MGKYMIEIDNVTKKYILGQIGGTTLHEELQRRRAKRLGKEDPTKKIGAKSYADGEEFWALNGVSFKVKKGERVGIIGHNGAGKSTLLKLLSRVTAPTSGEIGLDGRVTSMLEVGTGFHGEPTGRENIYMNGAILGMSKSEIDKKIDDIIEFSECGQFIDTPVKRYSSGMYVKLAFSVAAHLDSEIMIMDEVLAVGDMAFQKKCLDKMNDVSRTEGRTILYVSHNMNTIRQLCDRVVVLDHGKVIFDGDVEDGIKIYLGKSYETMGVDIDLSNSRMAYLPKDIAAKITHLVLQNKEDTFYEVGEDIVCDIDIIAKKEINAPCLRLEIRDGNDVPVCTGIKHNIIPLSTSKVNTVRLSTKGLNLVPGKYMAILVLYNITPGGLSNDLDCTHPAFVFEVNDTKNALPLSWNAINWGRNNMNIEVTEKQS